MADLLAVSFEGGEGFKDTLAFIKAAPAAGPGEDSGVARLVHDGGS
ncbi:hypothetical protein ACH41H_45795 [Streptomyces sp. NPDC020800]